jgi:hypothetical protein
MPTSTGGGSFGGGLSVGPIGPVGPVLLPPLVVLPVWI